ncbi:MAG TPA: hypothetical protein VFV62_06120 [Gaiellaceae bacterium]|nr:hypothetical protein [Gaiellaceae bacterium]
MRKLALAVAVVAAAVALPMGGAAAVSPTFRLALIHTVSGCHTWMRDTKTLGPSTKIVVKPATQLKIRLNCPMDFDFVQVAGPRLALGARRTYAGTIRTIVLRKPGVYKLAVTNVQTSVERNLQTLGPDNKLALTIVVR